MLAEVLSDFPNAGLKGIWISRDFGEDKADQRAFA